MKKSLFVLVVLCYATILYGKGNDIITLTNEMSFKGDVLKIKGCEVKFRTESGTVKIPAEDIFLIQFENPDNKLYVEYQELDDTDKCFKGKTDADMYHGKTGLHIALGVLLGPFAVIGAAVASPNPASGNDTYFMSKNKELFSDPAYLSCYKKKAKGQNVGNTAIGWGSWILLILLLGV